MDWLSQGLVEETGERIEGVERNSFLFGLLMRGEDNAFNLSVED